MTIEFGNRLTFPVGSFEVNCSILPFGDRAYIIDPGQEATLIRAKLAKLQLKPAAILLTHAHFDHIGAVAELQRAYPELPVAVHPADLPAFTHPMNQFSPDYPPVAAPVLTIRPEEVEGVAVIETPGHTPGGVCYHIPEKALLFSGDTLFAGAVGRTDLPGGDWDTLASSLQKLKKLPENTEIVPGHGACSTIGAELKNNPFLR